MELQQYLEQFRKQGLGVVGISYDSVGILADFAKRQGITFPLLSDPQSKIIKDFGIFNSHVQQNDWHYGIANPGSYRVNAEGVVQSKYFLADAHERYSAPTVLLREFGSVAGTRETVVNTNHLELKYYSTRDVLRPDVRFTLVADLNLKPKMHVYAPGVQHYIPISLELDGSHYFFAAAAEPCCRNPAPARNQRVRSGFPKEVSRQSGRDDAGTRCHGGVAGTHKIKGASAVPGM